MDHKQLSQINVSDETYFGVLQNLPISIVITDCDGRIIKKNDRAQKLFLTSNNMAGLIHHIEIESKRAMHSRGIVSTEVTINDLSYSLTVTPTVLSNSDQIASVVVKDITEEKNKHTRDLLAYRTALSICSNSNYISIIKTVLKQMLYSMDIMGISLMTLNGNTLKIAFRYSKLDQKKRVPLTFKIGEGVAGWVAKNKAILAVPDTSNDPLYIGDSIINEKSLLSLPILSNNKVKGVLNLSKKKDQFFNEEEIKMAEIVASRISLALESHTLSQQTLQEKNILEQVLANTTDSIALVNKKLDIILSNRTFNKNFGDIGVSNTVRSLTKLKDKFSEDGYQKLVSSINKTLKTKKTFSIIIKNTYAPSKTSYIHTTLSPFFEKNGVCNKVLMVKNDITELKNRQNQVQKQIGQIETLFRISSMTLSYDSNNKALFDNILGTASEIVESEYVQMYLNNNAKSNISDSRFKKFFEKIVLNNQFNGGYINNNFKKDPYSKLINQKINKIAVVPLMAEREMFGILFAINKETNYTKRDINWLVTIATRIALKIQTVQLFEKNDSKKRQLESILQNTADGIMVMRQGEPIIWNRAMTTMTGFDNFNDYAMINPERAKRIESIVKQANREKSLDIYEDVLIKNSDNEDVWLGINFSCIKDQQDIVYVISVIRNISKEKEIEMQQKEFVYTATHELRTPLTVIKGYLSMILNGDAGKINSRQRVYFGRTLSASERLINLVEELLKVARLEENKITYDKKPFNAIKLINEVVVNFTPRAKDKKLAMLINYKKSLNNIYLLGDYHKTTEALSNIVDNAIKYTRKGKIELTFSNENGRGIISVSDTGVGISKKDQANIFRKFIRISNLESVKAGGTGLGLYIVKNLIEQQGGSIDVESKVGKGTKFNLSLPIANNISNIEEKNERN